MNDIYYTVSFPLHYKQQMTDNQRNSQLEVSIDYMNEQILHLVQTNQAENARAILREWEELITHQDGDDAIQVEWMDNFISI